MTVRTGQLDQGAALDAPFASVSRLMGAWTALQRQCVAAAVRRPIEEGCKLVRLEVANGIRRPLVKFEPRLVINRRV